MPPTAVRRPPPARRPVSTAGPTSPGLQLPPRRVTWPRTAALCAAAALAGYGAAPLLGRPGLAEVALLGGLLAALAVAVGGVRAQRRAAMVDRLVEGVAPLLGLRIADRRAVRVRSWSRGWPGAPRRVALRYAPGVDDTDPTWRSAVVATAERVLLQRYQVARHDRGRARLALRAYTQEPCEEVPAAQARAQRTVTDLLGASAAVTGVQWADPDQREDLEAFTVRHDAGVKLAAPRHRQAVERVVSTMLPGRWRASWDLQGDQVRFEVRPSLPHLVEHPVPTLSGAETYRVPIAVGEDGELITWHLRGGEPHLMVVGRTGTGKTVIINGVVLEATARGWPVWICDPKRVEFMGLRAWPNVQVVATTVEDQVAVIYRAWEEMERRYAQVEAGADEDDFMPLVVVLDEYRDFMGAAADWYAQVKVRGMPAKCPVFEKVASLARKGRTGRVHLVLGTQRPDADFLSGEMRDNFATRISLGRLSPQGAMMMWENPYTGVSVPRGVPGRGTAVTAEDRVVEVQGYWTPDPRRTIRSGNPQDLAILRRLHPPVRTHPPLQVQLSEALLYPDDGQAQLWQAVLQAELVPSLDPPQDLPLTPAPRTPRDLLAATAPPAAASSPPGAAATAGGCAAPPADVAGVDVEEPDLDQDYEPVEEIRADQLQPGDLICTDTALQLWAAIEGAETDIDDDDLVCVDWRADDDSTGELTVPASSTVEVRRQRTADAP